MLVVLVLLAVGAGLIVVAVDGFPFIGGGDDHPSVAVPRAVRGATANNFDAQRAWALIRRQLSYGQRPAGSARLRRLAEALRRQLPDGLFEAIPGHPRLRNIVGTLPGQRPAIVVGAHYDTLRHPNGFVGANNGAAGTAVVIELARALKRAGGAKREVRFVLFDGEEPGPNCSFTRFIHCALRGSKAYVAAHRREVGQLVLLDYIANKGLRLPREASSSVDLWARVRAAARRVGVGAVFPPTSQPAIYDDHTPFLDAGIPAVDLIDFSYPYGHDVGDTLDRLSPTSLDAVGETAFALISGLSAAG